MQGTASFGRWLKLRRLTLDLTQHDLGRLVGCSPETIRKIEADERRPSVQIAERLAVHLAIPAVEHDAFVKAARAALCPDQLAPPTQTADQAPWQLPRHRRHNLPSPPTPLIGRDREVAAVCARLRHDGVRLLTLTGPGGVGKTRLAIQAATELRDEFAGGAWFVNLAPLSDPALVADTIAQALEVREHAGVPLSASLASHLRARQLLLLLDNFEQVVAAAPLIAELLAAAPGLIVLATSRAALRLSAEHEFVVPPLEAPPLPSASFHTNGARKSRAAGTSHTPAPRVEEGAADLLRYPAVELFVARALVARPDFMLTSENAPAVAEICVRLDGLPLALQLAAARIKLFAPQALVARLDRRLNILTRGARDLPARQQTLRDAIAWSYDLLNADEQALFRRLAVFVSGCTLATAEGVVRAAGRGLSDVSIDAVLSPQPSVLNGLESLVDKSLLKQEEGPDGEPRFTMLETIREYALERLAASGEADAIRRRHAEQFLVLAEESQPYMRGAEQGVWLARLELEHDNLRGALEWALRGADPALGVRLAAAQSWFWWVHGYLIEGRAWLEAALAVASDLQEQTRAGVLARATVLRWAGYFVHMQGSYTRAMALLEEAEALFRALGDQHGLAETLWILVESAQFQGDYTRAITLCHAALALYQELGDRPRIADMLHYLGDVAREQGDYGQATALLEKSLALHRELGDRAMIGGDLLGMGDAALYQGDPARAAALYQEALVLFRDGGFKAAIPWAQHCLGRAMHAQGDITRAVVLLEEWVARLRETGADGDLAWKLHFLGAAVYAQGDDMRAEALLREALAMQQRQRLKPSIAESLERFAALAAGRGLTARVATLLGAAEALRKAIGAPLPPFERPDYECIIAAARTHLDEATFAAAWAEGQALTLEQAIAYALDKDD